MNIRLDAVTKRLTYTSIPTYCNGYHKYIIYYCKDSTYYVVYATAMLLWIYTYYAYTIYIIYIRMNVTCTPYKRAFSIVCLVSGRGGSKKVSRPIYSITNMHLHIVWYSIVV